MSAAEFENRAGAIFVFVPGYKETNVLFKCQEPRDLLLKDSIINSPGPNSVMTGSSVLAGQEWFCPVNEYTG